jgi:uncharacterized protein (DUF1501 family)
MAERYAPTSMGAVSIGVGRPLDFVGGSSSPLQATSLGSFKYDPDYAYRVSHEHRLDAIQDILDTIPSAGTKGEIADAMGQGHALAEQIQAAVASYDSAVDYGGATPPAIARFHRDIATLVQYGFETRLYYTGFGGFDTHANQGPAAGSHATLLGRLDGAIGAFAQDMKAMGAWDSTVLVVISEFGRRNYQNGSNGTDHGHGNFFFAIGGGVRGGVYGGIISNADLEVEYLAYDVDFRDIYKEVLDVHLGMDPAPIFPEAQPSSTTLGFL